MALSSEGKVVGLIRLYSEVEVLGINDGLEDGVVGVDVGVTDPPVKIKGLSLELLDTEFLGEAKFTFSSEPETVKLMLGKG